MLTLTLAFLWPWPVTDLTGGAQFNLTVMAVAGALWLLVGLGRELSAGAPSLGGGPLDGAPRASGELGRAQGQRLAWLLVGVGLLSCSALRRGDLVLPGAGLAVSERLAVLWLMAVWVLRGALLPRRTAKVSAFLITACLLTALGAAVLGLLQVAAPLQLLGLAGRPSLADGLRADRVFHSPDALAVFLDAALAFLACRWVCGKPVLGSRGYLMECLVVACIAVIVAAVALTQSWIGGAGLVATFLAGRLLPVRSASRGWGVLVGVALGGWLALAVFVRGDLPVVSHAAEQAGQWQVWRACAWLMAQHPWLGWGGGSFSAVLPLGVHALGQVQLLPAVLMHPQNELLLWLVEGGAVAGLGWGCLSVYGVQLGRAAWRARNDREGQGGLALQAVVCTLPLLLSTQAGASCYTALLLPVLLAALLAWAESSLAIDPGAGVTPAPGAGGEPAGAEARGGVDGFAGVQPATPSARSPDDVIRLPGWPVFVLRELGVVAGAALLLWSATGWQVASALADIEVSHYDSDDALQRARTLNDLYLRDEVAYALNLAALVRFNTTLDVRALPPVVAWMRGYVRRRPEPGVYLMQVDALRLLGMPAAADHALAEGRWRAGWSPVMQAATMPAHPEDV